MHLPPCWPARILRLDVGRRDELAPLLGLVGDQVSKLGGRERKRGATPNRLGGRQGWNARSDQLIQNDERPLGSHANEALTITWQVCL